MFNFTRLTEAEQRATLRPIAASLCRSSRIPLVAITSPALDETAQSSRCTENCVAKTRKAPENVGGFGKQVLTAPGTRSEIGNGQEWQDRNDS